MYRNIYINNYAMKKSKMREHLFYLRNDFIGELYFIFNKIYKSTPCGDKCTNKP